MNKTELADLLKIADKKSEVEKIEAQMSAPDFWADQKKAATASQKLADLNNLIRDFEDAETPEQLAKLEKQAIFSDETDALNAILSIHAGAGGTEAQDWAEMLAKMFLKFAEHKRLKTEILDRSDGEEAGVKSMTIKIEGLNAYGIFKSEAGVHRLVRISPFDADKARHTSFALVEVIPEFEEVAGIEIPEKELKIDVFRASGHGGQSVNTTDSAVRLTHLPTKTVVSVQNERSQVQNRETALKILKSKLKKLILDEQKNKERAARGEHISAEWGNQIRSYVLMPYQQVKDHRTGFETSNPEGVLNGDLDGFVEAYLRQLKI